MWAPRHLINGTILREPWTSFTIHLCPKSQKVGRGRESTKLACFPNIEATNRLMNCSVTAKNTAVLYINISSTFPHRHTCRHTYIHTYIYSGHVDYDVIPASPTMAQMPHDMPYLTAYTLFLNSLAREEVILPVCST